MSTFQALQQQLRVVPPRILNDAGVVEIRQWKQALERYKKLKPGLHPDTYRNAISQLKSYERPPPASSFLRTPGIDTTVIPKVRTSEEPSPPNP